MHAAARIVVAVLGLSMLGMPIASAASFDCAARSLSRTEMSICDDPQLSRMEEQLSRRIDGLAARLNFGQYLGMRHWHVVWTLQRNECGGDRDCIAASFRAQARFLDRFQRCIASSLSRRGCLRDMIAGEQETMRR